MGGAARHRHPDARVQRCVCRSRRVLPVGPSTQPTARDGARRPPQPPGRGAGGDHRSPQSPVGRPPRRARRAGPHDDGGDRRRLCRSGVGRRRARDRHVRRAQAPGQPSAAGAGARPAPRATGTGSCCARCSPTSRTVPRAPPRFARSATSNAPTGFPPPNGRAPPTGVAAATTTTATRHTGSSSRSTDGWVTNAGRTGCATAAATAASPSTARSPRGCSGPTSRTRRATPLATSASSCGSAAGRAGCAHADGAGAT